MRADSALHAEVGHSGRVVLAAIVALIAAFCFAIASVAQHHVAHETETERTLNPRLFLELARRPLWWAGSFGDLFGFIIQGVALSLGAVALVQPLLVTGLLLAIPLSAAVNHRKVVRAEIGGALLCCAGLAGFLIAAQPTEGSDHVTGHDGLLLLASVGPVVVALVLASRKLSGVARSVALALSAGTLFAVCSPLLSVIVRDLHHLFQWPLATIAVCGVIGFLLTQNAYQAGSLPAPLACITICEPIVAVTLGVTLLHEHLDAGPLAIGVIVVSVVAVVIGVIMVARNAPDSRRTAAAAELMAA
jgi:drug/metabolite transporter (DMT)-like permease